MNTYHKTSKLYVISVPIYPTPVVALVVPDQGCCDNIAGQGTLHTRRWPGLARMLSTCAGVMGLAFTMAILVTG